MEGTPSSPSGPKASIWAQAKEHQSNAWHCSSCFAENTGNVCAACGTARATKDHSGPAVSVAPSAQLSVTAATPSTISPPVSSVWAKASNAGAWHCSSCCAENTGNVCAACGVAKDENGKGAAESTKVIASSVAAAAPAPTFSFGFKPSSGDLASGFTSSQLPADAAPPTFSFGFPATSSSGLGLNFGATVSSASMSSGFSFGIRPTETSNAHSSEIASVAAPATTLPEEKPLEDTATDVMQSQSVNAKQDGSAETVTPAKRVSTKAVRSTGKSARGREKHAVEDVGLATGISEETPSERKSFKRGARDADSESEDKEPEADREKQDKVDEASRAVETPYKRARRGTALEATKNTTPTVKVDGKRKKK